ncbi:hypothetical protein ACA910_016247 [Epithemia clementina (nom. ined.)]
MTYDSAGNMRNPVAALQLGKHDLKWYRLDDGVMGGLSITEHKPEASHNVEGGNNNNEKQNDVLLHFQGTINTNGGGFCSIRSNFPAGLLTSKHSAVKISYRGDGKTYKVLLSDGSRGGPMSSTPTWQIDLPTKSASLSDSACWDEAVLPLDKFLPSIGGRKIDDNVRYEFQPDKMQQIGLMLSLKLSNGLPNPPKTFGQGIFPFNLYVRSIQFIN